MKNALCIVMAWVTAMAGLAVMTPSARAGDDGVIALGSGPVAARVETRAAPLKPYVKELYTPGGVQVLLDSPPDHAHHHGLMFALAANGTNFWEEKSAKTSGRQAPRGKAEETFPVSSTGKSEGMPWRIAQALDWVAPGGKALLAEQRTVATYDRGWRHLDWTSRLKPAAGAAPVRLSGSHYFGLGLRLAPELNGKVKFIFPEGTPAGRVVRGDERLTSATWCAAAGEIGGKPVTVVMWDDPENQRHPAAWFTMAKPFAYLSATLDVEAHPLTLAAGEELKLHYGVAVFDGIADAAAIEKKYQRWLLRSVSVAADGNPFFYQR